MSASAHAAHSRSLNRFSLLCHKYICVRVSIFPNVSNFFASIRSQSRTVDIAHTQYADRLRITHALMEFRLTPRTVYVVFFFPSLPHLHSIKSYYRWCRLLKKNSRFQWFKIKVNRKIPLVFPFEWKVCENKLSVRGRKTWCRNEFNTVIDVHKINSNWVGKFVCWIRSYNGFWMRPQKKIGVRKKLLDTHRQTY